MQGTRKFTYASVSDPGNVQGDYTDATTWGELKSKFSGLAALAADPKKKGWVKSNAPGDQGYHLASDGTALPSSDFTIYFLVSKNDSGNN